MWAEARQEKYQCLFCASGVWPWKIWRTHGTEESPVSTHFSRRTDTHWLMTKAGESGQISNSIRYDEDTTDRLISNFFFYQRMYQDLLSVIQTVTHQNASIYMLTKWNVGFKIMHLPSTCIYMNWCLCAGAEAESVLVDPPEARRQTVEPEQLPHRHDPGSGRRGGHPRTHTLQRHLFPHLGGSLLVRALWH